MFWDTPIVKDREDNKEQQKTMRTSGHKGQRKIRQVWCWKPSEESVSRWTQ